ncbi:MAG: hypothetical protein QXD98_03970 [Candidatus Diapherotrites archaeon]
MIKFFAMLVLLLPLTYSLTINTPSIVPSNTPFSFSAYLDSVDTWEKSLVFVDKNMVISIYPNGAVVLDPKNGHTIIKAMTVDLDPNSSAGLMLYAVHSGLSQGEHTISIISDSKSNSASVFSIIPLDQNFGNEVYSVLEAQTFKLNDLETNLEDINLQLTNLSKKISVINQKMEYLEKEKPKIEATEKKQENFLSGFFNFFDSLFLPLGIIALIFIIAGLFMLVKDKLFKSDSGKDDFGLPLSKDEEEMATELADRK